MRWFACSCLRGPGPALAPLAGVGDGQGQRFQLGDQRTEPTTPRLPGATATPTCPGRKARCSSAITCRPSRWHPRRTARPRVPADRGMTGRCVRRLAARFQGVREPGVALAEQVRQVSDQAPDGRLRTPAGRAEYAPIAGRPQAAIRRRRALAAWQQLTPAQRSGSGTVRTTLPGWPQAGYGLPPGVQAQWLAGSPAAAAPRA